VLLSAHDFSLAANTFTDVSLTVRYDHAQIAALELAESDVHLWRNAAGTWAEITSSLDTTNKLVTGSAVTSLGQFAVTVYVPPPRGTTVLVR
jgi:hypothetical protein